MSMHGDNRYILPPHRLLNVMTAAQLGQRLPWAHEKYSLPSLYPQTKGRGKVLAILDTGCQLDHPDLRDNILDAKDLTGSTFGPGDQNSHGTHCCGNAASLDNMLGSLGVGPEIKIVVVKVLGKDGSGRTSQIAAGIRWVLQRGGVDAMSLSLGSPWPDSLLERVCEEADQAGVPIFAASGNDASLTNYPAKYCVAIGSCDQFEKISQFSSRGDDVPCLAPGEKMLATLIGGRYGEMTGTSMACPWAAGVYLLACAAREARGEIYPRRFQEVREWLRGATTEGAPGDGFRVLSPRLLVGEPVVSPVPIPVDPDDPPPVHREIVLRRGDTLLAKGE